MFLLVHKDGAEVPSGVDPTTLDHPPLLPPSLHRDREERIELITVHHPRPHHLLVTRLAAGVLGERPTRRRPRRDVAITAHLQIPDLGLVVRAPRESQRKGDGDRVVHLIAQSRHRLTLKIAAPVRGVYIHMFHSSFSAVSPSLYSEEATEQKTLDKRRKTQGTSFIIPFKSIFIYFVLYYCIIIELETDVPPLCVSFLFSDSCDCEGGFTLCPCPTHHHHLNLHCLGELITEGEAKEKEEQACPRSWTSATV